MTFEIGDDVFPAGPQPRCCVVCGQYERGHGFRMGAAKFAHGNMHVKEGTARMIVKYERYEFVPTAKGTKAAESVMDGDTGRCKTCGRVDKHFRGCMLGALQAQLRRSSNIQRKGARA